MFDSLEEIERKNTGSGHNFFSAGAIAFFHCEFVSDVIGGRFFITSERMDVDSDRGYTIRMARNNGTIEDVGEFRHFDSAAAAGRALIDAVTVPPAIRLVSRDQHGQAHADHLIWQPMIGGLTLGYATTLAKAHELLTEAVSVGAPGIAARIELS